MRRSIDYQQKQHGKMGKKEWIQLPHLLGAAIALAIHETQPVQKLTRTSSNVSTEQYNLVLAKLHGPFVASGKYSIRSSKGGLIFAELMKINGFNKNTLDTSERENKTLTCLYHHCQSTSSLPDWPNQGSSTATRWTASLLQGQITSSNALI